MNQALDLNLLKVLVLINKHRQLRPVAKALGKTESAVSKYLSKLRLQLDDQLFVRGAHHLEPTEFTLKLLPQISAGLDLLDNAIARQEFVLLFLLFYYSISFLPLVPHNFFLLSFL